MKLFRALAGAIRFTSLPPESRRLTFYSEGGNYWVHLEGIVRACRRNTPLVFLEISQKF